MCPNQPTDPLIDRWASLGERLSPYEALNLVGLLSLNPSLSPEQVDTERIVGEEKCRATGEWATRHFRQALRLYCQFSYGASGELTVGVIKHLAPILATSAGLSVGASVGFLFWALDFGLERWCKAFAPRDYEGRGTYSGDVLGGPFEGFFNLHYSPPVTKVVSDENELCPIEHQVKIETPEEAKGLFKPNDVVVASSICGSCCGSAIHVFAFSDNLQAKRVSGAVAAATRGESEPRVVQFRAMNVEIRPRE